MGIRGDQERVALTFGVADVLAEVPIAHELVHQHLLLLAFRHVHVEAVPQKAHQVLVVQGGNGLDLQRAGEQERVRCRKIGGTMNGNGAQSRGTGHPPKEVCHTLCMGTDHQGRVGRVERGLLRGIASEATWWSPELSTQLRQPGTAPYVAKQRGWHSIITASPASGLCSALRAADFDLVESQTQAVAEFGN